jgi:polyhydroxybutyrate depolymerase
VVPRSLTAGALVLLLGSTALAKPESRQFRVQAAGLTRDVLVYAPKTAEQTRAPVVFVFHGHGGTSESAQKMFGCEQLWPEAITVYMQGLPIATPSDRKGKKKGWQLEVGQAKNRDLRFFDRTLARLKKLYRVDERRIYATGHSNGGGFTYLLWAARADVFAAVAPSGAPSSAEHAEHWLPRLKPKPAFLLTGKEDRLAKFEWEQQMKAGILKRNGCAPAGRPWNQKGTVYPSARGTPLVELIHPGKHGFVKANARLIVLFFKEHRK